MGDRGRLWVDGDMTLRVEGDPERVVRVEGPFAIVGQEPGVQVRVAGPEVGSRHVYLHLDARGVYAVDLATRGGLRINGDDRAAAWIGPGDWIELGGQRIELLRMRVDGLVVDPPPCGIDLLAGCEPDPLVPLTLEPERGSDGPWTVDSELVFLGWSSACGIQVRDTSAGRVHCVLVRTASGAFVVDLHGQNTAVDGRRVRGASALDDGSVLTLGATPLVVHLGPGARRMPRRLQDEPAPLVARIIDPEIITESEPASGRALALAPGDAQPALLAWMVETIQQTQGAVIRQQGEMQSTLAALLCQFQQDHSTLLNAHLERIEHIHRELATLRSELAERGDHAPPSPLPSPPPQATPLRIERTTPEQPARPMASTTWLLQRVNQLERENRSAWKDLLGRLSARRTP